MRRCCIVRLSLRRGVFDKWLTWFVKVPAFFKCSFPFRRPWEAVHLLLHQLGVGHLDQHAENDITHANTYRRTIAQSGASMVASVPSCLVLPRLALHSGGTMRPSVDSCGIGVLRNRCPANVGRPSQVDHRTKTIAFPIAIVGCCLN